MGKNKKAKNPRALLDKFLSDLDALFGIANTTEIEEAVMSLLPRETVYVVPRETVYVVPTYKWRCPNCTYLNEDVDELDDDECEECDLPVTLERA